MAIPPFVLTFIAGLFTPGVQTIDLFVGKGDSVGKGSRYTVAYQVSDVSGKQFANSDSRGLPYSKELGDGHDRYFDGWVQGMYAGGVRKIVVPADAVPKALEGIVPPHADLVVTLRLLGVRRPAP